MRHGASGGDSARIARPALEFNLTEHCNLACAGCDHASPLLAPRFADLPGFERDATRLASVMDVGAFKLLGGEPLLHPELAEFVRAARRSGLAREVWVVTNGMLLHRMPDELFELIDGLWVSRYPGFPGKVSDVELERRARDHGFRLRVLKVDRFRATLRDAPHADEATIKRIYAHCGLAHRWSCHTLYEGRYYKCSPAPFLEPRLALHDSTVRNRERDGVDLYGAADLRAELERYLACPEPLAACRYCLGTSGAEYPHRQLTRAERAAHVMNPAESDAQVGAGALRGLTRLRRWIGRGSSFWRGVRG